MPIEGHWIQDCPTNNDREYDNRPRIKRTTGIPRSMLKAVESPNNGQLGQGVMVTPEGGYVVAQPDLYVCCFILRIAIKTAVEPHGKNK
jgi:protein MPE1